MTIATMALRSIGLLGVVVLGAASIVGSAPAPADCGAATQTVVNVVAEGQAPIITWKYESDRSSGLRDVTETSWQWLRLDSGGSWTPVGPSDLACDGTCVSSGPAAVDPRPLQLAPAVFKRDNGAQFKASITFICPQEDTLESAPATLRVQPGVIGWVDVDSQGQSTQPADVTVVVDATASFKAMAFGDNTYQWQRSNNNQAIWADVPGATDWALDVTHVRISDDQAFFRLNAINRGSGQSIFSHSAQLKVNATLFKDAEFADSNWTTTKIYDTTAAGNATAVAVQQSTGGDPGAYRKTTQTWTGGATASTASMGLEAAHLHSLAFHDPAQAGAIDHVDFSFDVIIVSQQGAMPGIAILPLLKQNGYYYQVWDDSSTTAWTHKTFTGLTASDFINANAANSAGPLNPDFSTNGAPIQFGYGTANGSGAAVPITTLSGIDNWNVVLTLK